MLSTVDELGTGRLRLPLSYITAHVINYGQPVVAECELAGVTHRFLCTATVAGPAATPAFDPSVQCGLHTGALPCSRGSQLLLTVKPVTSKVITATAVKVLVPEQLLGSPVASVHLQQRLLQQRCTIHLSASVSCQVLEVIPAGPASAVYRVVPSTAVTLVSGSSSRSSEAAAAGASAASDPQTPQRPARDSKSSSKTKSSSATDKGTKGSRSSSTQANNSSSSSKQAAKKKPSKKQAKDSSSSSSEEEEPAAAGGGGMFGLLDSLGDD